MTDKTKPLPDQLAAAMAEVLTAGANFEKASRDTRSASLVETDCKNRLNVAQRELDSLMTKIKKDANRDSDWGRTAKPPFQG